MAVPTHRGRFLISLSVNISCKIVWEDRSPKEKERQEIEFFLDSWRDLRWAVAEFCDGKWCGYLADCCVRACCVFDVCLIRCTFWIMMGGFRANRVRKRWNVAARPCLWL